MAARAHQSEGVERIEQAEVSAEAGRPRPAPASETAAATTSPALVLQEVLSGGLAEPEVKKWPPIATLGFILVTCGGFWAAVAFAATHLMK